MPSACRSFVWPILCVALVCVWGLGNWPVRAADPPVPVGSRYAARDTLACGEEASEDARQCLAGLRWEPAEFEVRGEQAQDDHGELLVRFPSPVDTGDPVNDLVAMEWYPARDADGHVLHAPAVVVVHESGRSMPVGRMIARGLRALQIHAFMIQLPGYGVRKSASSIEPGKMFVTLRQGIADVRRARDAVAALPHVDTNMIALQGTSLGGFVTATVAGLDHGYNRTFILLAGGNLHQVIQEGELDVARTREQLKAIGIEGEKVRELTWGIEPLRLAHRIDPQTTWLYRGENDNVVPPHCSVALADAARLPEGHHIVLPADHYSGIVLLPKVLLEIRQALVTPAGPAQGARSSDLSGHWQVRLDSADEGLPAQWYARPLASSTLVHLPGSLAASSVGYAFDAQTGRYGEVMPPYLKWPSAGYTDQHRADDLGVLVSSQFYRGACWYESEIDVPDWGGDPARLCLERVKWTSRCWVDGREVVGEGNHSLYTPHRYELGVLAPGVHRLTLRIDNRPLVNIGIAGHGYGMETEPIWNGVAGRMQLEALDPVRAESVRVQPAPDARSVTVLLQMARQTRETGPAEIVAQVVEIESGRVLGTSRHQGSLSGEQVTLHIALDEPAQLWDEFQPRLYDLVVVCQNAAGPLHRQHTRFGFRTWRRDGRHAMLNGERVFLRGNVDCAIHPGSDTPPTDRDWWQRVLEIHKQAGFNHIRFHTWCPPEAAFDVADELGLYFQIETAYWVDNWIHATEPFPPRLGEDAAVDAWVREESLRIIRAYERHPSFAMFCIGNEFGMDSQWDTIAQITAELNRATDQVLVSGTTARQTVPPDEYWVTHATGSGPARGIGPPHTNWDFAAAVRPVQLPVISHETGQRPSWPDYDSLLPAFGDVMQPWNLKRLRERAEAAGVHDHARRAEATARFALAQYKAEHEGMRRTDELAGYQLLMLHDFTGQGEALVGLLDCFFREKPGITLEAVHSWNGPTVPLARFDKYTWLADETFTARLQVSHQGSASLTGAVPQWKLFTRPSGLLAEGTLPAIDIARHTLTDVGEIRVPLSAVDRPAAVTLQVTVGDAVNSWNLWVYPPGQETDAPPGVVVAQCLDAKAEQALGQGGRVLLLTHGQRLPTARAIGWQSTYWTGAWGWGNGLGLLCEADHPALAGFPTELQSDWQWYELAEGGECLGVPPTAPNDGMIVQQISDFHTPAREACVYEARVGGGRLLVCTLDVASDLERRPAARALRASLLTYAGSAEFQPRAELTLQAVRPWLRTAQN